MTGGSGGGENGRVLAVRAWEPAVSGRGANSLQLAEVLWLITITTTDSDFCYGSKLAFIPVLDVKIFFHTTGFDHKTSCLAHGFLTNSPK